MQKVSLEVLQKLLPPGGLAESDQDLAPGVSFGRLCREYDEISRKSGTAQDAYGLFTRRLEDLCPPIMFVGDGSSRAAFICQGGFCLKVAKNSAGVAQNRQEEKHTANRWWRRSFDCFVRTYGHSRSYGLLLSECCAPVESESELARALGAPDRLAMFEAVFALAHGEGHDIASAVGRLRRMACQAEDREYSAYAEAARWLDDVQKNAAEADQLKSLVRFWRKYGMDELLPGDVINSQNWGYAIRDGQIKPVIVDAGFSRGVQDKYYGKSSSRRR